MSEYAERDPIELGEYFTRHMHAMTAESLHDKFEIAAELAARDQQIDKLRVERETLKLGDEEIKALIGWAAGCVKDNGWVDAEYGVKLFRNAQGLSALQEAGESASLIASVPELQALVDMLEECKRVFTNYTELHLRKGSYDKATRNQFMADRCQVAIEKAKGIK